jgi:hypothetical protein
MLVVAVGGESAPEAESIPELISGLAVGRHLQLGTETSTQ